MTVVASGGVLVLVVLVALVGTAAVGVAKEKAGLDDVIQRKIALGLFGVLVAALLVLVASIVLVIVGII
jgi:hypothetical protein